MTTTKAWKPSPEIVLLYRSVAKRCTPRPARTKSWRPRSPSWRSTNPDA
jgi:hypothetical protein